MTPALLVIAKTPVPGRVKTRLTPPCSPEQAAALAQAALDDTLAAVGAAGGERRRVLVLDGEPGDWIPEGFEVVPQRGAGLGERLAAAFDDAGAPALLIGMDTPQVTPGLLEAGLLILEDPHGAGAVFGPATDGGYWAIGLRRADAGVFTDVPMSLPTTGAAQRERLASLRIATAELPPLLDVDTIGDARVVASGAPASRFAAALSAIEPTLEPVA